MGSFHFRWRILHWLKLGTSHVRSGCSIYGAAALVIIWIWTFSRAVWYVEYAPLGIIIDLYCPKMFLQWFHRPKKSTRSTLSSSRPQNNVEPRRFVLLELKGVLRQKRDDRRQQSTFDTVFPDIPYPLVHMMVSCMRMRHEPYAKNTFKMINRNEMRLPRRRKIFPLERQTQRISFRSRRRQENCLYSTKLYELLKRTNSDDDV